MRVGVDARELCGHPTGVGRYLHGLLDEWSRDSDARRHEFVLYTKEPYRFASGSDGFTCRVVPGTGGTLWEQRDLKAVVNRDHLDVFFAPGYTAPLLIRVPTVVAIHDVSFAAHPEWFSATEGLRRRVLSRLAATAASAVITISEFSRTELTDLLGVPAGKIHVIPPGVTSPAPASPARPVTAGRTPPRVLYVGSIFNRRRVPDLVQAVQRIARTHADVALDLVGDNRSHPYLDVRELIKDQPGSGYLRWHRYLPDAELADLYRSARAFAFLSEYEGLGLPPLEALAAGVPAVLLDTPVARESCGDSALYVPAGDVAAVTDALKTLLFDEERRRDLLSAAPATLARFDWAQAARRTLAVLEGAA